MLNKRKYFVIGIIAIATIIAFVYAGSPEEEAPVMTRSVVFTDGYNGKDIAQYSVEVGKGVNVPEAPTHELYVFIGWYNYNNRKVKIESFDSILNDTHAIALYGYDFNGNGIVDDEETKYTVKFIDSVSGEVLEEESVLPGSDATAPILEEKEGYEFIGWDKEYTSVNSNLTVKALYKKNDTNDEEDVYYTVTFVDGVTSKVIQTVRVKEGLSAGTPKTKIHAKKLFDHWDGTYTNVRHNQTVRAIYVDDLNSNGIKDTLDTKYTIKFESTLYGSLSGKTEYEVLEGLTFEEASLVVPTTVPKNDYYKFDGWDKEFEKVTKDETYTASFVAKNDLIGENGPDGIADEEQKYTLTINYIYYDGFTASDSYVWETNYDLRTYMIESPNIKGHKPDIEVVSGTIGSDGKLNRVVTVTYTPIKYNLTIVTGCSDEKNCKTVENAFNKSFKYGTVLNLPDIERKYTLTYKESDHFDSNTSTETVEKKLIGYCKGSESCSNMIDVGAEITIPNEDVTYYAVFEGSLDVTLKSGRSYETSTYDYIFKTWNEYEVGTMLTLTANKTVTAQYEEVGHLYNLTIKYRFEDTDEVITDVKEVRYGEKYSFNVEDVAGYTHEIKVIEGTMSNSDIEVEVLYKVKGITYRLETYLMNLDGSTYSMTYEDIDATVNQYIEILPEYVDGFKFNTDISVFKGTVEEGKDLILKLYYDRNKYNITYKYTGDIPEGAPKEPAKEQIMYGQKYTVKDAPVLDGYIFDGWYNGSTKVTEFNVPSNSVILKGSFVKID